MVEFDSRLGTDRAANFSYVSGISQPVTVTHNDNVFFIVLRQDISLQKASLCVCNLSAVKNNSFGIRARVCVSLGVVRVQYVD